MRDRRQGSLMIGASILLHPRGRARDRPKEEIQLRLRGIAYAHARLRCAFIAADSLWYCFYFGG